MNADYPVKRRPFLAALGVGLLSGLSGFAESMACKCRVTLKDAHKGTLEIDTQLMDSYGNLPADICQFYLDARAVFAANPNADFTDPAIIKAARTHGLALMGGPMLGNLTANEVSLWLRPTSTDSLTVHVAQAGGSAVRTYSVKSVTPGREQRVRLDGLSPNTAYTYAVSVKKRKVAEGGFTTAPTDNTKGIFRITFGSCAHKIGVHNANLFREILRREPQAMLLLGDIAVDDRENKINMHRADYQLRDVSKPWKTLAANVPLYASWDDHDYFNNDLNGIPRGFTAADRDAVRAVWHQNWNNPPTDKGRDGIYFNTRMGPVEVIMLDTRSCRDNACRNETGCYLGQQQMSWLKKTLKSSTAPFKVISSGTMWSDYVSKAKDSWGSWDPQAREEIFSLIEKERINGVLLISGDRHGARGFRISRPSGFAFHEFEAATLGGVPGPAGLVKNCPEQLFGYNGNGLVAFGEFTFDTTHTEPAVTFRLINESGGVMEEHSLQYSQLTLQS